MESNEFNDEVITDDVEDNSEPTEEVVEEAPKEEKPKRTPQEELEYFEGRAARIRKKLGLDENKDEAPKKVDTSKPSEDLDYGEKAYLRSALNLKGSDELQLARDWKKKYGSTVEEMETDEVFINRLNGLREARETMNAIPKGKNRSGQTGVTDADIAFAKFQETGKMPEDFKTRVAVKNKIVEAEQNRNMFSGPSVIGPTGQSF